MEDIDRFFHKMEWLESKGMEEKKSIGERNK